MIFSMNCLMLYATDDRSPICDIHSKTINGNTIPRLAFWGDFSIRGNFQAHSLFWRKVVYFMVNIFFYESIDTHEHISRKRILIISILILSTIYFIYSIFLKPNHQPLAFIVTIINIILFSMALSSSCLFCCQPHASYSVIFIILILIAVFQSRFTNCAIPPTEYIF